MQTEVLSSRQARQTLRFLQVIDAFTTHQHISSRREQSGRIKKNPDQSKATA